MGHFSSNHTGRRFQNVKAARLEEQISPNSLSMGQGAMPVTRLRIETTKAKPPQPKKTSSISQKGFY
jgi:hypothetical protein